jgi:hypothetical protein
MLELIVQLFNDDFGTVTLQNEPGSLDEFTITQARKEGADGFVFEFSVSLDFTKEGGRFISAVYQSEGPDGIIGVNIYSRNPNTYLNDLEYLGQLKLDNYNQKEARITTNIEPIGFERKFLNQLKRPVAMNSATSRLGVGIGAAPVTILPLAPKTIRKQAIMNGPTGRIESGFTPNFFSYIRIGSPVNRTDFEESFLGQDIWITPTNLSDDVTTDHNFVLRITESGSYTIDLSNFFFDIQIDVALNNLTRWDVDMYYQKNVDGTPQNLYSVQLEPVDFDFQEVSPDDPGRIRYSELNEIPATTNITDTFEINDEIYLWFESGVDFVGPGTDSKNISYNFREGSDITITGNTVFPQTNCNGYMVYEFLEHLVQFLTDQVDVFRSDFFGRTDTSTVYGQDGEGSLLFITNGAEIRQLENRRVFGNWEDAFQSLTSLYCLGWGFETLTDGTKILRCEQKDYFYDKTTVALEVDSISDLEFFVDTEVLYGEVLTGFPEIENINQVNAIDEFMSERTYGGPVINAAQELDIRSVYRGSGFEIESIRRLIDSTEESRLDDQNFMIAVKRAMGGGFEVELGSDFTSITGVFDPDTTYNMRISPGRNILRWKKILASTTLRSSDKVFRFASATQNYLVTSQFPGENLVGESDDVPVQDSDAIFYAEKYTLNVPLSKTRRDAINTNIRGTFKSKDWKGLEFEGFFDEIQATIAKGEGSLTLRRIYRDG